MLNQQFQFSTFLQVILRPKEIVFYSKRPIGLFFHALSYETNLLQVPYKYFIKEASLAAKFQTNCQIFLKTAKLFSLVFCLIMST